MPINLKTIIQGDSAVGKGGFSGAVFLTYTLNLGFFEQIVVPALEQSGCSNILIIADPDGYVEAIEAGRKIVAHAGIRYVCTPMRRMGFGVQHAKMLFMVGPERGRLLIGSGNLTLHGYSRNLEVYSHFELDRKNLDPEAQLAFHSAWSLLQEIVSEGSLHPIALQQLEAISEKTEWLKDEPANLRNLWIWNNYRSSIWSQFIQWRGESGFSGLPLKELRVFSPYYDHDGGMLSIFTEMLLPDHVNLYLSRDNTTLDGKKIHESWPVGYATPNLFEIMESREGQGNRLLHAKMIIGVEESGCWCIAGSANMTRAAFDQTWKSGSNLELVTVRWSPDPTAFDYVLKDLVTITPIELTSVEPSAAFGISEEPNKVHKESIFLTELTFQKGTISGKLSYWRIDQSQEAEFVFLNSGEVLKIQIDKDFSFALQYSGEIKTSEAAIIRGIGIETLPCWIDVPEELQKYGSRSYQARIQAKLDTIAGAESLVHELIEFLFDRIHLDQPVFGRRHLPATRGETQPVHEENTGDRSPAPEPERFVVPERDASGNYLLTKHTQYPYDRDISSLRDLLSIALLRLTQQPEISTETKTDEEEQNLKTATKLEPEEELINVRKRLCKYVVEYCKRYSQRLCQIDFIEKLTPEVLFENHLTIGRVLLEFNSHVDEFTPEDFTRCYWLIWAPLIDPSIVSVEGRSSWQLFTEKGLCNEFLESWKKSDISSLFIIMTGTAFGQPYSWHVGLHQTKLTIGKYLALQKVISEIDRSWGIFRNADSLLIDVGIGLFNWEECVITFEKLAVYQSPVQERVQPLIEWDERRKAEHTPTPELMDRIQKNGLSQEFYFFQNRPEPIMGVFAEPDNEDEIYCPRCGGALRGVTITELKRGKLALCNVSSDAWLYKKEHPLQKIL